MNLNVLAEQVGELAQRTRLNAINLAVVAAKVKLADPAFRAANERIIQLVTRATEVAARVDRLSRQLNGNPTDEGPVETGTQSLGELESYVQQIEELSAAIVSEVRRLKTMERARTQGSSASGG